MIDRTGILPGLPAVAGKPVHVGFDGGRMTSDAGILLLAALERRLRIVDRLAACLEDPRDPDRVRHGLAEMIRYRALLIAAGYPDGNDRDAPRADRRLQDGGRAAAGERRGPVLAADHQPAGEPPRRDRAQTHDGGDGRVVLRQLRSGTPPHPARHRRHRGPGARRPATGTVERPLRQPVFPADPHLRGDNRQAGGGHPRVKPEGRLCAPARRRTGPRWRWCCVMSSAASALAGRQSRSSCAATAITAGPRR